MRRDVTVEPFSKLHVEMNRAASPGGTMILFYCPGLSCQHDGGKQDLARPERGGDITGEKVRANPTTLARESRDIVVS